MTVYLLPEEPVFPPAEEAEPDGLIAIGGDLTAERLLQAYAGGIFPWFKWDDEFYWFSPDPRLVLFPDQFKISNSLKRTIRSGKFNVTFDTAFETVIRNCAEAPHSDQDGTWINDEFIEAYLNLHKLGFAHSVEVWYGGEIVGGLYGVSLGAAFFGESMFHKMTDASKVAFHALAERCRQLRFILIDCQVESPHLLTLGAHPVPRKTYLALLKESLKEQTIRDSW